MGKNKYKLIEERFQARSIQSEESELEKEEYDVWLDETDKREMEEAQGNWKQYCEEMGSDSENKNDPTT